MHAGRKSVRPLWFVPFLFASLTMFAADGSSSIPGSCSALCGSNVYCGATPSKLCTVTVSKRQVDGAWQATAVASDGVYGPTQPNQDICVAKTATLKFVTDPNYTNSNFQITFGTSNPFPSSSNKPAVFAGATIGGTPSAPAQGTTGTTSACFTYSIEFCDLSSAGGCASMDPKVIVGGTGNEVQRPVKKKK